MAFEDPTRHPVIVAADVVAAMSPLALFFQWLPTGLGIIATCLSIIWFALNISDHALVRYWWAQRRRPRVDDLPPDF